MSCQAGFQPVDNLACEPCGLGFYKESAGIQPCQSCSFGLITEQTGTDDISGCVGECSIYDFESYLIVLI